MTREPAKRRRWTDVVSTVLSVLLMLTVVAAALALIVVPKLNDARPLTVLTGSMSPTYPPGDVVVVREVDPERLRVGQVITFQARAEEASVTTHRIVGVQQTSDGPRYVTRGDANGADDPEPIRPEQVRGAVWYAVPKVGYLGTWASGGTLRLAIDVGAAALVLYGGALVARGFVDRRKRGRATG